MKTNLITEKSGERTGERKVLWICSNNNKNGKNKIIPKDCRAKRVSINLHHLLEPIASLGVNVISDDEAVGITNEVFEKLIEELTDRQ